MKHSFLLLLVCTVFLGLVKANTQLGLIGLQNPSSLQWEQIETKFFRFIYPKDLAGKAQELANLLEKARPYLAYDLKTQGEKLPIVLQNQTVLSNGFVTLAPWHSQFFMTPLLSPLFSQSEWATILAIHEYRHVVQISKNNGGFNRVFSILFGEAGVALGTILATPSWYLEGDAVHAETVFSSGGRGRNPQFLHHYKAMALSAQRPSFDQLWLRSYETYYPNQYPLGYLLTTKIRRKQGNGVFARIHEQALRSSFNPWSMQNAIEERTGKDLDKHTEELLTGLSQFWAKRTRNVFGQNRDKKTAYPQKSLSEQDWNNYLYPSPYQTSVFALKTGLGTVPSFVLLDSKGEETPLLSPSILPICPISQRKGTVVYQQLDRHVRWGQKTYSDLALYQIESDSVVSLSSEGKYFCPQLSPDAKKIVALELTPNGKQKLVIFRTSGEKLLSILTPKKKTFHFASWHPNGKALVITYQTSNEKMGIATLDLATKRIRNVFGPVNRALAYAKTDGKDILFQDFQSGTSNIYLLATKDKAYALTDDDIGAYYPFIVGDDLYFNRYTLHGHRPHRLTKWKSRKKAKLSPGESALDFSEKLLKRKDVYKDLEKINDEKLSSQFYDPSSYSILGDSINFHSWFFYAPPLTPNIGGALYSQNYLDTLSAQIGADYNLNEASGSVFAGITMSALFPVFTLNASHGDRSAVVRINGSDFADEWKETIGEIGVVIPLRWPWRAFTNRFEVGAEFEYIDVSNRRFETFFELSDTTLTGGEFQLRYSLLRNQAVRDLFPMWGFDLRASLRAAQRSDELFSSDPYQVSMQIQTFFPGMFDHHSLWARVQSEQQDAINYRYPARFLFPRGYDYVFFESNKLAQLNYSFPVVNPDLSLGDWVYLKRIKSNTFYDHLRARTFFAEGDIRSMGQEVLFETHFFRLPFPIDLGLRASYRVEFEDWDYGIFFNQTVLSF